MRFIVRAQARDGSRIRVDLQGLRGFGVLLVLIGHLWLWPPGAFAALDIFFVLSGFFITGILIDQYARSQRIRFKDFYAARMRRLLPTALTTIVVTILLTGYFYSGAVERGVATQGFWAAIFLSNWYFIHTQTNYFTATASSPMLHFWSLSVEEQFYLFWPLLTFLLLRLARRRRARSVTPYLLWGLGLSVAIFFAYSWWHSQASPTAAYFSTLDRAWEFGAGGIIAVLRPHLKRTPRRLNITMGWVAALTLFALLAVMREGVAFPAPLGLAPVLATCAVIASGVNGNTGGSFLITNVPMVYLGTISYSLYLWHLPINYLLRAYYVDDTLTYKIVAFVVALAVGSLSYHLLERPMRRARFLMTGYEKHRLEGKPPPDLRKLRNAWIAVGLVGAVASVYLANSSLNANNTSPDTAAQSGSVGVANQHYTHEQELSYELAAALAANRFPDLNPPLSQLTTSTFFSNLLKIQCTVVTQSDASHCMYSPPGATKTVVVIGDSIAMSWTPGLRRALEPEGWAVQQFTMGQCPAETLATYTSTSGGSYPQCGQHHQQAVQLVRKLHPDMVILASGSGYGTNAKAMHLGSGGPSLSRTTLGWTLQAITPLTKRVVVLESPVPHASLQGCDTHFSKPASCASKPAPSYDDWVRGESEAARKYGAQYVRTLAWFCVDDRCPGFVGSTPVTADGEHLTIQYSQMLAPVLRDAILGSTTPSTPAPSKTSTTGPPHSKKTPTAGATS